MIMIEIQYSGTAFYYYWWTHIYQQYESTTVLKITSAIKVATIWKLQTVSITNGNHHVPTTKSTLFAVSKDKCDTKEGPGKSMKNALYIQQYGKRYSRTKVMSNSKPVASVIVKLCESEGISQSVKNSVK